MNHRRKWISIVGLFLYLDTASAVEFQPLGSAVAKVLGTTKAFQKKLGGPQSVFYSKDPAGHVQYVAVVEKGIYEPACTHTWVVGLDAKTARVRGIEVVEMSCQHAYPTRAASYTDQYKNVGPAELATLDKKIQTIAKATGSSVLLTDAVKRSVKVVAAQKGVF